MARIYVAGKLNDDAVGYVKNLHSMCFYANEIMKYGHAVFVPGIDFMQGFLAGNWEYKDYFDNSQEWLKVSDAVFVCPNSENSKGTKREIALADSLDIPIYYQISELQEGFNEQRKK